MKLQNPSPAFSGNEPFYTDCLRYQAHSLRDTWGGVVAEVAMSHLGQSGFMPRKDMSRR